MKQEIFDFFAQEHDINLLDGQWSDIINLVDSEFQAENKALKEKIVRLSKRINWLRSEVLKEKGTLKRNM